MNEKEVFNDQANSLYIYVLPVLEIMLCAPCTHGLGIFRFYNGASL